MSKRRFPTQSELILLKALRMPMYGMELADHVTGVGARGIYALLGRLRTLRYVKIVARIYDVPGKPRRMYEITDDGQACVDLAEQLEL
jgi:DNA-binding PadR family transcriptional regulator